MKKSTTAIFALAAPILMWISAAPQAGGTPSDSKYDAQSWKSLIPAACKSFFDGCNNCRRAQGSDVAACTRKACAVYEKPRCLDAPITEGSPFDGRLLRFECDDGRRFGVYYGEYVSGDQRVRLAEDEIMLSDPQTRTAYRLRRERAASGAKYSDGSLEFWEHGGQAMLRRNGQPLYAGCRVDD
jgi:membrane-bound inhibitor of C-type lysozyme